MTETKEQILTRMEEIMPFTYSEKVRPYIIEAMKIHADQQLILSGVSNWLACKDELPKHGETVLTYTPLTEMASEQVRLMKYGTLKSGFPAGITHWKRIDKPTCY